MKAFALFSLLCLTFTPVFAQDPATVVEIVTADDNFSTLATALETAGLVETLSGKGPFTVFAPTNEAFEALPEGELDRLLANPGELRRVLSYHVAGERLMSEAVSEFADDSSSEQPLVTLQGETLRLTTEENLDEPIYINNEAVITEADIEAGNGVVHIIDTVLLPQAPAGGMTGGDMTGGSPSGQ